LTQLLSEGLGPQDIAMRVLEGYSPEIIDEMPVAYYCPCSRERMERALVALGKEELAKLAEEAPETELSCHFCLKTHVFTPEELHELILQASTKD
jgi:molecular chaperone Hsp33